MAVSGPMKTVMKIKKKVLSALKVRKQKEEKAAKAAAKAAAAATVPSAQAARKAKGTEKEKEKAKDKAKQGAGSDTAVDAGKRLDAITAAGAATVAASSGTAPATAAVSLATAAGKGLNKMGDGDENEGRDEWAEEATKEEEEEPIDGERIPTTSGEGVLDGIVSVVACKPNDEELYMCGQCYVEKPDEEVLRVRGVQRGVGRGIGGWEVNGEGGGGGGEAVSRPCFTADNTYLIIETRSAVCGTSFSVRRARIWTTGSKGYSRSKVNLPWPGIACVPTKRRASGSRTTTSTWVNSKIHSPSSCR